MLRWLARWSDSHQLTRRVRRGLLEAPGISGTVGALDRWRLRRVERAGDAAARSKSRWREAPPDPGLTWGRQVLGDAVIDAVERYRIFGPDRAILEVGPGYGRVVRAALSRGTPFGRYTGLDISEENVRHLRDAFADRRIEFVHGDVEAVSLDQPVDAVLSFLTFKHLYPSFEAALVNLRRELKPGGSVMFDLIEGSRRYFHRDRATFMREYTRPEITEILDSAALELVAFDRIEHAPERARLLVVARKPHAGSD